MIPELPIWSIRPNWVHGVTERLEWLTDVLVSSTGAEQRRALRQSPRRFVEFTVNPTRGERTFLTSLLLIVGSAGEWLVPLWYDKARLIAAPVGTGLSFDNRWRDYVTDGWALLYRDTFTFEAVEIASQDDTGLTLAVAPTLTWTTGDTIFPLRRGWLVGDNVASSALTGSLGEAAVGFTIVQGNDYSAATIADSFEGLSVIANRPNRIDAQSIVVERMMTERDGLLGLIDRKDSAGRGFATQTHNWTTHGREAQHRFRQLLYAMRGRQNPVWLPSFNDDLIVSRPTAAGAASVDVLKAGLAYLGIPKPGRNKVIVNGQILTLTGLGAAASPVEEKIVLGGPIAAALARESSLSFVEKVRLNQDAIELHHHTDIDGATEIAASFRAFSDTRVTTGPIYLPVPASAKTVFSCGSPEAGNECVSVFPGWFVKMFFTWTVPCSNQYPGWFMDFPFMVPNAPKPSARGLNTIGSSDAAAGAMESGLVIDPVFGPLLIQSATPPASVRDFSVTFYYPVPTGAWHLQTQYPAFLCGSVGLDNGIIEVTMQNWNQPAPILVLTGDGVGNFPQTWDWNWVAPPLI